jgi:hypothetical protein
MQEYEMLFAIKWAWTPGGELLVSDSPRWKIKNKKTDGRMSDFIY